MSVAGKWNLTIKTPMGDQKPVLTLTDGDGTLSGSLADGGEVTELADCKADGAAVSWKVSVKKPIPMTLTFNITIDGDSVTGTCRPGMFPPSPVTGIRA